MSRLLSTTALVAGLMLGSGAVMAQQEQPGQGDQDVMGQNAVREAGEAMQQQAGEVSHEAQDFVDQATMGNMFEIQSSRLARQRSQDPEVRDFAERMISDHTELGGRLQGIVRDIGATMPEQLNQEHRQRIEQLERASGDEFERLYMREQVEAHETATRLYEQYARRGQNEPLTSLAEETLPILEGHLRSARQIQQSMETAAR